MTITSCLCDKENEPKAECPEHGLDEDTIVWLSAYGLTKARNRVEAALGHTDEEDGKTSLEHRDRVSGDDFWAQIKFPPPGSVAHRKKALNRRLVKEPEEATGS